jgi:hypothetical protein
MPLSSRQNMGMTCLRWIGVLFLMERKGKINKYLPEAP